MGNLKMEFQQIWIALIRYVQKQGFAVFLLCVCLAFLWQQEEQYRQEARRLQMEERARVLLLMQQLEQRNLLIENELRKSQQENAEMAVELAKCQTLIKKNKFKFK